VGRTRAARATKYIEFHGCVMWPHVYLPACGWTGAAHGEEATVAGANSTKINSEGVPICAAFPLVA
jgi:hypothetical protein